MNEDTHKHTNAQEAQSHHLVVQKVMAKQHSQTTTPEEHIKNKAREWEFCIFANQSFLSTVYFKADFFQRTL
jgi:hypothetical protein